MPAWGGHANGRIPEAAMREATVIRGGNGLLRTDASLALDRLGLLALADGHDVRVTDLYRTYAVQVILKEQWCDRGRCQMAATPGTSNHGWGDAVDNGYGYGPKSFGRWMHANEALCKSHGWYWPAWARRPRTFELWHWEYLPGLDQHRNQLPAGSAESEGPDDMIYPHDTPRGKANVKEYVEHLQRLTNGVNHRAAQLDLANPVPMLRADGIYGSVSQTAVAIALGTQFAVTGVDLNSKATVVVTPAEVALLAQAVVKLGELLESGRAA